MLNFLVLDQKKITNLMREGGKKKNKKKNIKLIFLKVNEGDKIKKTFDLIEKMLMRKTKKNKKT